MSTFHYTIEVGDPRGRQFEQVRALVDTGATFTTVPADMLRRLGVTPQETRRFRLADGTVVEREIGETLIRLDDQVISTVVVFGQEGADSLLGVYTLERALLAVDPVGERLVPTGGLLMEGQGRLLIP